MLTSNQEKVLGKVTLCPLCFLILWVMPFSKMLSKAASKGLVQGLLGDFKEGGVLSLQYADDTILFSSAQEPHLRNLKHILIWFE